jgi:hypothetical protein
VSTRHPEAAASVNIGSISYRARCTAAGCKDLGRMLMIYADAEAARLVIRCSATGTPARGWGAIGRPGSRSTTIATFNSSSFDTIEFRIIYLQRKQSRLLPESHHQGWALAHPLERATSMQAQLRKAGGTEVG